MFPQHFLSLPQEYPCLLPGASLDPLGGLNRLCPPENFALGKNCPNNSRKERDSRGSEEQASPFCVGLGNEPEINASCQKIADGIT